MIIFSKNIITHDDVVSGYIEIEKNIIKKITKSEPKSNEKILDYSNLYIMPGIINIDSHDLEDRSKDKVPLFSFRNIEYSACLSGVTSLYHTIFYSEKIENSFENCSNLIDDIKKYNQSKISLIDNKINLKFDVKSSETMENVKKLLDNYQIDFLTFDYFSSRKKSLHLREEYLKYHLESKFNLSSEKSFKIIKRIRDLREESNIEELSYLLKTAHHKNISVSTSQYQLACKLYTDFKDTFDIINIDSYNKETIEKDFSSYKRVSAKKIVEMNDKDIESLIKDEGIEMISADYRPTNILMAVIRLSKIIGFSEACKLVTKNPANALRLPENIGEIKEGNIANIICFVIEENMPTVVKLISNGEEKVSINH